MTARLLICALALMLSASPLAAQVRPQPGRGNPHLQTVQYDPDQVVRLSSAPGYQLTVGLATDEHIESVAVGDSATWQISTSSAGDHLFLKPLRGGGSTNMTVVTTNRVYAFDLVALSSPTAFMAYTVQFTYPATASERVGEGRYAPRGLVGEYRFHGDDALRPVFISDDGEHTFITWPERAALPATYYRDANDVETLANGHMRDGIYVIDSIHDRLIFRIDGDDAHADRFIPKRRR